MPDNIQDKGDDKNKQDNTPKTIDDALKIIGDLTSKVDGLAEEKRELLHETMSRKEKLRQLEQDKSTAEELTLKEQNKYKELYEKSEPRMKRLDTVDSVLNQIYEAELQTIPEDKRDVVPTGNVEDSLLWIKTAKSKGLFEVPKHEEPKPNPSIQSKTNTEGQPADFLSWSANDPKLTSLTQAQYAAWKRHNQLGGSAKVTGWGG